MKVYITLITIYLISTTSFADEILRCRGVNINQGKFEQINQEFEFKTGFLGIKQAKGSFELDSDIYKIVVSARIAKVGNTTIKQVSLSGEDTLKKIKVVSNELLAAKFDLIKDTSNANKNRLTLGCYIEEK